MLRAVDAQWPSKGAENSEEEEEYEESEGHNVSLPNETVWSERECFSVSGGECCRVLRLSLKKLLVPRSPVTSCAATREISIRRRWPTATNPGCIPGGGNELRVCMKVGVYLLRRSS